MKINERERLINRIRQIRRVGKTGDEQRASDATGLARGRGIPLEERVSHLEQMLQGLQDSVHRESERQGRRIAELEARIEPGALGEALSRDARERGL